MANEDSISTLNQMPSYASFTWDEESEPSTHGVYENTIHLRSPVTSPTIVFHSHELLSSYSSVDAPRSFIQACMLDGDIPTVLPSSEGDKSGAPIGFDSNRALEP